MNPHQSPFTIIPPVNKAVPIIISVPHCGTSFPEDIIHQYQTSLIQQPDDTDWFVHQLYSFASDLGITIIHANYSRWVIDLNRNPDSKPLYDDGRIITALCPSTDFLGNELYLSSIPNEKEIKRRLDIYYWPYYQEIEKQLEQLKAEFGKALLWDAHSIRQFVPTIQIEAFPDMILGNNDKQSCDLELIKIALEGLEKSDFQINHNTPFKGGHITRYFGQPNNNIHALQLEMNKILYMDDTELNYNESRANQVTSILKPTFEKLIKALVE